MIVNANSLENNPEREARVREYAYQLWEAEGRPHGRDVEFWVRARELIASEENPPVDQSPDAPQEVATQSVDQAEPPRPRRKRRA
jgi:hypothetical protein